MYLSAMSDEHTAFAKCPLEWIEARDFENLSFEKATWIPLAVSKTDLQKGRSGHIGHRRAYRSFEAIIVPLELRDGFKNVDWQSVAHRCSDGAWEDEEGFHPPGSYGGDPRVLYPVIRRSFETGEPTQWDLLQELEVGLQLFRKGDSWIRPDENDVEVAKLERNAEGSPSVMLLRAEHLRDYLCAKKAALLLTGFNGREAVEEEFPGLGWEKNGQERHFEHGEWEGTCSAIHEGGHPYGVKTAVLRMWRESVDPEHDVPEMPHPREDPGARSESVTRSPTGRKLHRLSGRIWVKHWILPAQQSPRIRRDKAEARVHFQVENQESKTLSGEALADYRGWLWFRPGVIRHLANQGKGCLKWYTAMTGEVGPASNRTLHFGVNRIGLVNVLGYKMAELPEWAQKLWVAFNLPPEGGLSEELHMSQNLASPAETMAPEAMLLHNLHVIHRRSADKYGQPLLQKLPGPEDFFRRVHRFYCDSFEDICELCKELHRTVVEPVDLGLLNAKIDPANAAKANQTNLGSIKRLALWLDAVGLNGRDITRPLAAVYDLRIADAHAKEPDVRASLELLGISRDSQEYQAICFTAIGLVANCVAQLADVISPQAPPPNPKP
jgi:hypothetical protein